MLRDRDRLFIRGVLGAILPGCPDRRDPDRFHEAKDDLAAELRALAWQIARTARP